MELLKQPLWNPCLHEQVITLCAATNKVMVDMTQRKMKEFQMDMLAVLCREHKEIGDYPARCFGMNMPKSRDIQAKIPLPQAIWNEFWLVTVNGVNSESVPVRVMTFIMK